MEKKIWEEATFTLHAVNVKTVNEDYLGISDNFLNNILLFLNLEVL